MNGPAPAAGERRFPIDERTAVGILIAAGVLLRLAAVDRSLWVDEIWTLDFTASLDKIRELYERRSGAHVHPPLYFLLVRALRFFGDGPTLLRTLILPFGTVSLWFIWRTARLRGGAAIGMIALVVAVLSPVHIRYSVELRPYPLTLCFSAAASFFFFRLMTGGTNRDRAGFIAATVLNLYSHYFAFPLYAVHALFLLLRAIRERDRRWPGIAAAALPALLILPWAANAFAFIDRVLPGAAVAGGLPSILFFVKTLIQVLLGFAGGAFFSFLLGAVLAAVGLFRLRRSVPAAWLIDLLVLILPVAAVTILRPSRAIEVRYFLPVYPLWLVLVGGGLGGAAETVGRRYGHHVRRGVFALAALLPAILLLLPAERPEIWIRSDRWTDVRDLLEERVREEDRVASVPEAFTVRKILAPMSGPALSEKINRHSPIGPDFTRPFHRLDRSDERLWLFVVGKNRRVGEIRRALSPIAAERRDYTMVECTVTLFLIERTKKPPPGKGGGS